MNVTIRRIPSDGVQLDRLMQMPQEQVSGFEEDPAL